MEIALSCHTSEATTSALPDACSTKRKRSLTDDEVACLTALDMATARCTRTSRVHRVKKVISGGQSGADRAALVAAKAVGLTTGGWVPWGFYTSQGQDLTLRDEYGLQEIPLGKSRISIAKAYVERSKRNVDDADATIAFRLVASVGTDKTIGYALTGKWMHCHSPNVLQARKPCLVIRNVSERGEDDAVDAIEQFILLHRPRIINVAGHRAAKAPADFAERVEVILRRALNPFT